MPSAPPAPPPPNLFLASRDFCCPLSKRRPPVLLPFCSPLSDRQSQPCLLVSVLPSCVRFDTLTTSRAVQGLLLSVILYLFTYYYLTAVGRAVLARPGRLVGRRLVPPPRPPQGRHAPTQPYDQTAGAILHESAACLPWSRLWSQPLLPGGRAALYVGRPWEQAERPCSSLRPQNSDAQPMAHAECVDDPGDCRGRRPQRA